MVKKKINTITCHEVYNHGASLQEYALLNYLISKGFEAETIHYKPTYLSNHFKLWNISPRFDKPILKQLYFLTKLPGRLRDLKRKEAFDKFAEKYIPSGNVRYENNDDLKLNIPDADIFICGSDQIWNSFFQNGKDPAFYLNFVPDDKLKVSYAASFAIDEIAEEVKPLVQKNVSRLNAVGVRETSGIAILKGLGINNAVQVLDPVFLISKSDWFDTFVTSINNKFIFVYDFDSNPLVKKIALFLKEKEGWDIYTVNNNINYADKNFWLDGPEQFLSLVAQSQFNITNSFHSVAFSIIFEKQFIVLNRTEKINTRMRDVLSLFQMEDKLISDFNNFNYKNTINYTTKTPQVLKGIEKSKEFLMNSLLKNIH
jgi:hypothetical protein